MDVFAVPKSILGAAWRPQQQRMKAGIYFPLYIVLRSRSKSAVYYLPTEFQLPRMFKIKEAAIQVGEACRLAGFYV